MREQHQSISSGTPLEDRFGYSRAVRIGNRIVVSGTAPSQPDGGCDPDAGAQMRRCLEIVGKALDQLGASFDDVVLTRIYITDPGDADLIGTIHGESFGTVRPVATMVVVNSLLDPRWKVELEVEAALQ